MGDRPLKGLSLSKVRPYMNGNGIYIYAELALGAPRVRIERTGRNFPERPAGASICIISIERNPEKKPRFLGDPRVRIERS